MADSNEALLAQESLFLHETCLQDKFHGAAAEVLRGSRSCGLSLSFLTENSRAGWSVAQGQFPPLAPSDNELFIQVSVSENPFLPSNALAGEVALKEDSHQAWVHLCYGLICLRARTETT